MTMSTRSTPAMLSAFRARHGRALLGLGYLVLVGALVSTSVLAYRKALPWQDTVAVTLQTKTPGLELNPQSDVKFQGMRVGEVREITSDGRRATVRLALDPDRADLVPAALDAAIVPKTLFGEKYVDLLARPDAGPARISDGDVIRQSRTAVEIGTIYAKLVPLLRAVDPAKLSELLGALADALDGRGAQLGETVDLVDRLLGRFNPSLDTFQHDVRQFARTADLYSEVTPELLRVLANSTAITEDLLVPSEKRLERLLATLTRTADTTGAVLDENDDNLITLAGRARPVLRLLDEYSTMLPCLVDGLKLADHLANQTAGSRSPFIYLTIDMFARQKPYTFPDDLPSNPKSDGHVGNLPAAVAGWDPYCGQVSPQNRIEDAPPGSLSPLPNQTAGSPHRAPRSSATTPAERRHGVAALLLAPLLTAQEMRLP